MFLDIAPSEFLLTAIVAVVVIGPKDLPLAMRTAGKWMGKMRRISNHFRAGVETMIREAELAEMEKTWREQNAAIMAEHPPGSVAALPGAPPETSPVAELAAAQAGEHAHLYGAEATALPAPDVTETSATAEASAKEGQPDLFGPPRKRRRAPAKATVKASAPDAAPEPPGS